MKATKISLIAVLIAGVLAAYTPAVCAQDAKEGKDAPKREGSTGGGQRADAAKERLNKLAVELKLTEDQKPKVEAALKERLEKSRGLREAAPEERREKNKAAQEELSKKMKGILTAEQFAKWEKMPQGRGQGGAARPGTSSAEKKPGDTKGE